jgi:hypothetical protein
MRTHSRTCRVLVAIGLAGCLLTFIAWMLSARWTVGYDTEYWTLSIGSGRIGLGVNNDIIRGVRGFKPVDPRWIFVDWWDFPAESLSSPRGGDFGLCLPGVSRGPTHSGAGLPCWVIATMFATPPAVMWWRSRRMPAGHCQKCGYNLTGNVSGRCPECGTAIRPQDDTR